MKKTFGSRLKELRGPLSQAQLAGIFGIAQQTYGGWEKDQRRPDITELCGICQHFNVSADWLLGLSDADAPTTRVSQVAETALYEQPAQADPDWKSLALSQQQTIAQLTKLLADAAEKKDRAKTLHAPTTGASSRAG